MRSIEQQLALACADLGEACNRAELTRGALFLRYIGLGGLGSARQVADHCAGGPFLPVAEHNVLVQAINERFLEVGTPERVTFL